MTDSDDTDVLLLIPPKFFLANTSSSENSDIELSSQIWARPSVSHFSMAHNNNIPSNNYNNYYHTENSDFRSNNFMMHSKGFCPSKCIHSTPKPEATNNNDHLNLTPSSKTSQASPGILNEIDNFLVDVRMTNNSIIDIQNVSLGNDFEKSVNIHPLTQRLLEKHNSIFGESTTNDIDIVKSIEKLDDEPLISLNDIWSEQKSNNGSLSLHEERLRRMVCLKFKI